MNRRPSILRGLLAGFVMCLNTALVFLPVFGMALLKLLIPLRPWRRFCTRILDGISALWIDVNRLWVGPLRNVAWQTGELSTARWYLVTSNHQSWADIFIAQSLLNRRIPQMKFFLKQELIWVPVVGLCWWALDYPFMKRYSRDYLKKNPHKLGKDLATARKACRKFNDRPAAIFNFMEGTRLTAAKHRKQRSPYRHLLKPKTGGTGLALDVMGNRLDTLLDVTIRYPGEVPDLWAFLCGNHGEIAVTIREVPIPAELRGRDYGQDADFRAGLQRWVQELWAEKDRRLEELARAGGPVPG